MKLILDGAAKQTSVASGNAASWKDSFLLWVYFDAIASVEATYV